MNKLSVIIGIVALLIAIALFGFGFWVSPGEVPPPSSQPITQAPPPPTPTQSDQKIPLVTEDGAVIQVRDFTDDITFREDESNPGNYYFGYQPNAENPAYIISYIDSSDLFTVSLLQEPLGVTRKNAEQYLRAHLGISEAQMCDLNYMVTVPVRVNSNYAGTDLGFSFCPDAMSLGVKSR